MKAANTKPGMTVAKGAIANGGSPTAAMVSAAIGTPTIMLASMCRRVFMGMSLIMSMVLVIMSRLSTVLLAVVVTAVASVVVVVGTVVVLTAA